MGGRSCHAPTSCSEFPYGSGRSNTASTTPKIAAADPMPIVSVATTAMLKPGDRRSERKACEREDGPMARLEEGRCLTYGRPPKRFLREGEPTRAGRLPL